MTDITGMWKLVAIERQQEDGEVYRDDAPTGYLLYTPEGWLAEAFQSQTADGGRSCVTYCGSWELGGENNEILYHIPSVHPNQESVGTRLERRYELDGDRFTLIAGTVRLQCERLR